MNEWGQQLPFETLPQMSMNYTIYFLPHCKCAFQVFVYSSVCSCMPPLYEEVMQSCLPRCQHWGAVKKSTDLHSDWISSQILLTSRVPASALSTPPFRQSQPRKFPWSVQWPELTYSPVDIQSSSNFDWKYLGLHIKIPFYFAGAINSVATVLCVKGS